MYKKMLVPLDGSKLAEKATPLSVEQPYSRPYRIYLP
jgi:hypothetical protein